MQLSQHKTKPQIRSILEFSKQDLIESLKDYAVKQGYIFRSTEQLRIWCPSHPEDNFGVKLVIDIDGEKEPIEGKE